MYSFNNVVNKKKSLFSSQPILTHLNSVTKNMKVVIEKKKTTYSFIYVISSVSFVRFKKS